MKIVFEEEQLEKILMVVNGLISILDRLVVEIKRFNDREEKKYGSN